MSTLMSAPVAEAREAPPREEITIPLGNPEDVRLRRVALQAQAADARSRQAIGIAEELRSDQWTKAQHMAYATRLRREWMHARRLIVVLVIACAVLLFVGMTALWALIDAQASLDTQLRGDVRHISATAERSCLLRNETLGQQVAVYGALARSFEADPDLAEQARILRDAQAAVPDGIDCSAYRELQTAQSAAP